MNAINKDIEVVAESDDLISLFDTDLETVAGGGVPEDLALKTGFGGTG